MFGFSSPKVPSLTVEEAKSVLDSDSSAVFLDVRTPNEVAKGKIEKSINIPLDTIGTIESKLAEKSQKIVVYCLSGSRSVQAVDQMIKLGYTNVFDMKGGLLTWRGKRLPTTS